MAPHDPNFGIKEGDMVRLEGPHIVESSERFTVLGMEQKGDVIFKLVTQCIMRGS